MELKKGETIMIDAALHLPASFLHEAFSDRSGVPLDFFELYHRGKRLEGEAALSSWGVEKDSTIEVKMRGRGGMPSQGNSPSDHRSGPQSSRPNAASAPSARCSRVPPLPQVACLGAALEMRVAHRSRRVAPVEEASDAAAAAVSNANAAGSNALSRSQLMMTSGKSRTGGKALLSAAGSASAAPSPEAADSGAAAVSSTPQANINPNPNLNR